MLLFRDIKQNYPVYILDKSSLELVIGKVIQVGFPHVDPAKPGGMVIDVTIEASGKSATYMIPDNLCITDAGASLVLSTERENLVHEVEALRNNASQILSSVDKQKEILEKSSKVLEELSPVFRDKQQYEERFKSLESGMSDIKTLLTKILNEENTSKKRGERKEE